MGDLRTVVEVATLPLCDFCQTAGIERPARYDFRTRYGPWAYGCGEHYDAHRGSERLGTGSGQLLVVPDDPLLDPR